MGVELNELIACTSYDYYASPWLNERMSDRTNCYGLVHLVYSEYGIMLPRGMGAAEIMSDENQIFCTLEHTSRFHMLDILGFSKEENPRKEKTHVAIATGRFDQSGDPLLLHINQEGIAYWSLQQFLQDKRYENYQGAKRLLPDLWQAHVWPLIGNYL